MKRIRVSRAVFYATSALLCAQAVSGQSTPAARKKNIDDILATEKAFAKMSMDSAQAAFNRYLSPDATLFRPRAVRASDWSRTHPLSPDVMLTWQTEFVDIARSGDYAYTVSQWASTSRSTLSDPHFGEQLMIWRRQKDGRWLGALNASIATPADKDGPDKVKWPAAPSPFVVGKPVDERTTLLNADNAFANSVKTLAYGVAVKAIAAPDMRLLREKQFPTLHIDSIVSETNAARVTMWLPIEANVAPSADLGYTRGSYVVTLPRGREAGDYIRVWRRDKNGTWHVALDMMTASR